MRFLIIFFSLALSLHSEAFNPFLPDHSLEKSRDKIMEKLTKRLEVYDADNIVLSYGKSPRKLIKNVIVYYNGYYAVSFHSKKDNQDYSCDVNIGDGLKTAQSGKANIYLMNCRNKNDNLFEPTELIRLFEDQHQNEAIKGSVKFSNKAISNALSNIMLFDIWSYDVEYKRATDGRRVRCIATLNYVQMPQSLVDQRMDLDSCKEVPNAIKKLTEDQEILCTPELKPVLNKTIESFEGKLSQFYSNELAKKWPLPKKNNVNCSSANVEYWKELAEKMISLREVKLKSKTQKEQDLEKIVLENNLINQAYGRLYLESRKDPKNVDNLNWLSVASHSSPLVGLSLRKGYLAALKDLELQQRNGLLKIAIADKEKSQNDGFLASYFLKRPDVTIMVGEGNKRVFLDMFWQNLAAAFCGASKAEELNKALKVQYDKEGKQVLSKHHENLENAWKLIKQGSEAFPPNKELIQMGNLQLLWVEQNDILQSLMYGSTESKIVAKLGIFNSLARSSLTRNLDEQILTFDEYCNKYKLNNDLSDVKVRYQWMKYVVSKQTSYVQKAEQVGLTESLYTPALADAYYIFEDYK